MTEKKDNLLIIRCILFILISGYGEDTKVYSFYLEQNNVPIYLTLDKPKNTFNKIRIYESTLKNLLIYIFQLDYQDLELSQIVLITNKYIKQYTLSQMATLLEVKQYEYERLANGTSLFKGKFSFENISKKLEFNIDEFYFSFKKEFKLISGD